MGMKFSHNMRVAIDGLQHISQAANSIKESVGFLVNIASIAQNIFGILLVAVSIIMSGLLAIVYLIKKMVEIVLEIVKVWRGMVIIICISFWFLGCLYLVPVPDCYSSHCLYKYFSNAFTRPAVICTLFVPPILVIGASPDTGIKQSIKTSLLICTVGFITCAFVFSFISTRKYLTGFLWGVLGGIVMMGLHKESREYGLKLWKQWRNKEKFLWTVMCCFCSGITLYVRYFMIPKYHFAYTSMDYCFELISIIWGTLISAFLVSENTPYFPVVNVNSSLELVVPFLILLSPKLCTLTILKVFLYSVPFLTNQYLLPNTKVSWVLMIFMFFGIIIFIWMDSQSTLISKIKKRWEHLLLEIFFNTITYLTIYKTQFEIKPSLLILFGSILSINLVLWLVFNQNTLQINF